MWERLAGAVVVGAGLAYLVLSLQLAQGTVNRPGPGFFPSIIGVLLLSLGIAFAITTRRRPPPSATALPRDARRRVLAVFGGLAGFCLLLPVTGYPLAAFLFVAVILQQLGASWLVTTSVALTSAGASYYVFAALLGVPLPRGLFD